MWKVIILSTVIAVVQGANINDIYGNYTMVLEFADTLSQNSPNCLRMAIAEDRRENNKCSCPDGHKSTLVQFKLIEIMPPVPQDVAANAFRAMSKPILAVDDVNDIQTLVNVTCSCAEKDDVDQIRSVMKKVNDNYMLIYDDYFLPRGSRAVLWARTVPSTTELEHDIAIMDEGKNKKGSKICTREIYEQLRSPVSTQ